LALKKERSNREFPTRVVESQRDPLQFSTNDTNVVPAAPEKPARIGRKSMARRSGQNGSIQKDGKWYVVRYWKDVPGQEKRVRVRAKICPISGPGKLSVSERERKAKEIIAASGVDTKEYFDRVVTQSKATVITFRQQVETWLAGMRNRRSKPVAPSTLSGWESGLKNWLNPNLGDLPLEAVDNLALKKLVNKMVAGGLSASTIRNYADVVKMVVTSVINEKGDEVYPRKWNDAFINMPVINPRKQRTPSFTGDVVSSIVATREYTYSDPKRNMDVKCELKDVHRMLFILCAASGLRFGEALGIGIPHVSPDGACIHICQKAWRGQMHDFLKTRNGEREIDLHPSVAKLLREFIGTRKSGLLFRTRTGQQLHQSNILRRVLHPILEGLGQPKCGAHAFRRFRNTYLRNYTSTPPGVYRFWMGHASGEPQRTGETMSDRYDKAEHERALRKEWAERAGLGFELPRGFKPVQKRNLVQLRQQNCSFGPNGPKTEILAPQEMAASL